MVKSSLLGLLAVSVPNLVFAKQSAWSFSGNGLRNPQRRYPAIDDEIVSTVVGASHFDLDKVKELVEQRPELSRAAWDWGFGDWETAIGAASHVGRRDIVDYLVRKGARPDIFTYAMLGALDAVEAMIVAQPGVQTIAGPHGITLLQHARTGLKTAATQVQKDNAGQLINYLEALGNADIRPDHKPVTGPDKEQYLGDYRYGDGEKDGLSVKLNMGGNLSLGRLGSGGGALNEKSPQVFSYNYMPSVEIRFNWENDQVVSLTVHEPDLILSAEKVKG